MFSVRNVFRVFVSSPVKRNGLQLNSNSQLWKSKLQNNFQAMIIQNRLFSSTNNSKSNNTNNLNSNNSNSTVNQNNNNNKSVVVDPSIPSAGEAKEIEERFQEMLGKLSNSITSTTENVETPIAPKRVSYQDMLRGRISSDEFERILIGFVEFSARNNQDQNAIDQYVKEIASQWQIPQEKLKKALASLQIPKPIPFQYPSNWGTS